MHFNTEIVLFIMINHVLSMENFNFTLYEVTAYSPRERAVLYQYHIKDTDVVFLNGVTNEAALPMNIAVRESYASEFEKLLNYFNIQFNYANPKQFLNKNVKHFERKRRNVTNTFLDWDSIMEWINDRSKTYPLLEKQVIGKTYQNRNLILLKVSTGSPKPAVFVLGGETGRDWIASAVILNYINDLLNNYYNSLEKIVDRFDFYFLPVANPDGYVHSMEEDRSWGKNRKTFFPTRNCAHGKVALGVNIDRNWFWVTKTVSENECNGVYSGQKGISEEEPKAIYQVLNRNAARLIAFIAIKGFTRLITVPYANADMIPNNYDLMMEILSAVSDKVRKKFKTNFYYGSTARFFYNYSGNCADWVKIRLNVPIVYTIYLQYEDSFFPQPAHIRPLTEQFRSILNQTLSIAGDIYGPLFNYAKNTSTSIFLFATIFFLCVNIV